MTRPARRVRPWTLSQSVRPTCRITAACAPAEVLEAFAATARARRYRVTRTGERTLQAVRGTRFGPVLAGLLQIGPISVLLRIGLAAEATSLDRSGSRLAVTCTYGVRELTVATKVARVIEDTVLRLERSGVLVEVHGWVATPEEPVSTDDTPA